MVWHGKRSESRARQSQVVADQLEGVDLEDLGERSLYHRFRALRAGAAVGVAVEVSTRGLPV